jgi:hypothetical protein
MGYGLWAMGLYVLVCDRYGLWAMGYGLCDMCLYVIAMGYGLWAMGLYVIAMCDCYGLCVIARGHGLVCDC